MHFSKAFNQKKKIIKCISQSYIPYKVKNEQSRKHFIALLLLFIVCTQIQQENRTTIQRKPKPNYTHKPQNQNVVLVQSY